VAVFAGAAVAQQWHQVLRVQLARGNAGVRHAQNQWYAARRGVQKSRQAASGENVAVRVHLCHARLYVMKVEFVCREPRSLFLLRRSAVRPQRGRPRCAR